MKKLKKLILLILAPFVVVGTVVSMGHSFHNSAPNFECFACHQAIGEHETKLNVKGIPKAYKPGETYELTLTVDSTIESIGEVQGGFAVRVNAGELIVRDDMGTQLSNYPILTHTVEGSEKRVWQFGWKAPRQKTDIELMVMAVAANGDFSPVGDATAAMVFTIKPAK
jgi:hypothetical protein